MYKIIITQLGHSLIATVIIICNPSIETIFAEDHQIDANHILNHKIDIVERIDEKINKETITLDQTQIGVIPQIKLGITLTQILEIATISMIVQETLQKTETETTEITKTETTQIIEIETIRITDHKNIHTKDHKKNVIIHPVITLELETTTIRTEQETFLNHRIETIHNCRTHKIKAIEALHQNIKNKLSKYNLQMMQIQTLQVSTKQKLQNYN